MNHLFLWKKAKFCASMNSCPKGEFGCECLAYSGNFYPQGGLNSA